jgi:hypothetical protein
VRKPVATLDWLLSRPCKAGKRAAQAVKALSMPSIGDNELRVIYLKRMGYGFKAIGKQIGFCPHTVRYWLIRAGFTCDAGTKSPAFPSKRPPPFMSAKDWGAEWRGVVDNYSKYLNRGTLHRKNPYRSGTREYARHWITVNTGKRCRPMSEYLKAVQSKNLPRKRRVELLRRRLSHFIKSTSRREIHLFGCSAHFMRQHIESQFKRGMTWENRREWHIDHIRPCASFEFLEKSDALICFNWKNLRPVFASVNARKGAKWRGELWEQGKPKEKKESFTLG